MKYFLRHSAYSYASPENLKIILEKHPGAVFVEEVCLKNKNGGYTPNPGLVFYIENPPAPYKEKFFAYYQPPQTVLQFEAGVHNSWVIAGLSNFNTKLNAMLTIDEDNDVGYVTISRFGHDYVRGPIGDQAIDGGRDNTRVLGNPVPTVVTYDMFTKKFEKRGVEYDVERLE